METGGETQHFLGDAPGILDVGVERELWAERRLVVEREDRRLLGGVRHARSESERAQAPPGGARALDTDIPGTDELDLPEAGDDSAGEVEPHAAGRSRVHDHRNASLGEELGGIDERAVDDLARGLKLHPAAEHAVPQLRELEHPDRHALLGERTGNCPGDRGLAAARRPADPDRPTPAGRRRAREPVSGELRGEVHDSPDGAPGILRRRVDDELGSERRFVGNVHAGDGGTGLAGLAVDATRSVALTTVAFALPAHLERPLELDLGEPLDRRAREVPPSAPVRRRVHDHRHARRYQRRRHVYERPVHDVTLRRGVGRRRREKLPDGVELEHDDPLAERLKLGRSAARQARLAASREPRDPDRPAHRGARNVAGRVSGSNGAGSSIARAKRISATRVSGMSAGYQRGWAITSARKAKTGGSTSRSSASPEAVRYVSTNRWKSGRNGSATAAGSAGASLRSPKNK